MLQLKDYLSLLGSNDTVLLRVDFNIPRDSNGEFILNDRVYSMLPIIKQLIAAGCAVILVSHLGRPKPGVWQAQYSFARLVAPLAKCLEMPVAFLSKWPHQKTYMAPKTVALAENTRFLPGELDNDIMLVDRMLEGVDLVIMEAFACSHRSHASTVGIVSKAKRVCLGAYHQAELQAIRSFQGLQGSRLAVVGGKKLLTKLPLVYQMLGQIDTLCLAGGLANTLLHSFGYNLGTSWVEYGQLNAVKELSQRAKELHVNLLYPQDVMVSEDATGQGAVYEVAIDQIKPHEQIIDIGSKTKNTFITAIKQAHSVYWNGPLGRYECAHGMDGTSSIGHNIAKYAKYSLVGGGDTLACLLQLQMTGFSHISTGGGAFLYFFAHNTSAVLEAMEQEYV